MDKQLNFRPGNLALKLLFLITIATLAGCTIARGVAQTQKNPQLATSVIPVTGDDVTAETLEAPTLSTQAAEESIDLTAYPNTIWVDVNRGSDVNKGISLEESVQTIQQAARLAVPGTVVRVMPGIYHEEVIPASSGTETQPILYIAEEGLGSVLVRGSESSSSLTWTQLTYNTVGLPAAVDPRNIYYADISTWGLETAPRYLVELDNQGEIFTRINPAREPDWHTVTEYKYSEHWWSANGGSTVAGCDPTTNANNDCDFSWRSYTQLTDTLTDTAPTDIEAGNLKTLGNISGATLIALDARHGNYIYRRTVTGHEISTGRITVNERCEDDGNPGLGWGSKYYLENHPALVDHPGEWWYDKKTQRLYLWPTSGKNPAQSKLEISRYDNAFDFSNQSNIILNGFKVELFNGDAYRIINNGDSGKSYGDQIKNCSVRYANRGIVIYNYVVGTDPTYAIDGFLLENSEVSFMDSAGMEISFWWPDAPSPNTFSYAGVRNTTIRNNVFHHLAFASQDRSAVGIRSFFPDHLTFEGNHLHHVAQNGFHLHLSLIDSTKVYGLSPDEILLGDVLIKDNLFEDICLAAGDCAGLKIGGGSRPDTHVFRDFLVSGNIFRNIFGWSNVSILRGLNDLGDGNGFYSDYASGIHLYRNISYNNSGAGFKLSCLWHDGDMVLYNNIAANNYLYGFKFTGSSSCDDHNGSVNTQLVNNIIINNGLYGIQLVSAYENQFGNLVIDHNLYFQNGWNNPYRPNNAYFQLFRASLPAQYFLSLDEIRQMTLWEDHGEEGNPFLLDYDASDNSIYNYFWPDFRPTVKSAHLLDQGPAQLATSLQSLMSEYQVPDILCGKTYDIGRFEFTDPLYEGSTCFEFQYIYLPIIKR